MTYDDLAQRYIDAWNETERSPRRAAVDQLYTEDASYIDPMAVAEGREAITSMIGAVQEQFPDFRFRLAGPAGGHHKQARLGWEVGAGGPTGANRGSRRRGQRRLGPHPDRTRVPRQGASNGLSASGLPGRPALHNDGDDGPVERNSLVLKVFLAKQGVAGGHLLAAVVDRRYPVGAHPPQLRPIVVVVVDEHAHLRVGLDVGQPAKTLCGLTFGVDGGVHHVVVDREDDRDQVRCAVGPDRGKHRYGRLGEHGHHSVGFGHWSRLFLAR